MNINIICYKELGEITIWDKKFNSVGNKYTTKVISTKHVSAETLKSLENSGNIKLLSTGLFDGYTNCSDASIINDLEVITIPSGGTANIKYYNGKFIDSGNLLAISSNKKLYNLKYIYYYLQKHINLIENAFRGASIKHPQMEDILAIKIPICDIDSQNKIVSILSELDNKIEKENQFTGKLKKIKQSFLELLFPNNNNNPKLRFENFTDTWEQRKLGEVSNIVGGGTPSTTVSKFWDGTINWYTPAELSNQIYLSSSIRKITEKGLNNCSAKMLPKGTVLFTSRAGIGKTAILKEVGCTNQGFQSIIPHKDKLDTYFIYSQSEKLKNYGETVGAGSTFVEVSGKQMAEMNVKIPQTFVEQKRIGTFFETLDKTITLHQRKPFHLNFSL